MSTPAAVTRILDELDLAEDRELTDILTSVHALGEAPAPRPSPALAALLSGAATPPARGRVLLLRRRVVAGATALGLAAAGATGVAAAANELPDGAQRLVARFSEHFLPFAFPPPERERPLRPAAVPPDPDQDDTTPAAPRSDSTVERRTTTAGGPASGQSPQAAAVPPSAGPSDAALDPSDLTSATAAPEEGASEAASAVASPAVSPSASPAPSPSASQSPEAGDDSTARPQRPVESSSPGSTTSAGPSASPSASGDDGPYGDGPQPSDGGSGSPAAG